MAEERLPRPKGQMRLRTIFLVVLVVASVLGVAVNFGLTPAETTVLAVVVAYIALVCSVRGDFFRPQWALGLFLLIICGLASVILWVPRAGPLPRTEIAALSLTVVLSGALGSVAFFGSLFQVLLRVTGRDDTRRHD